MVQLLEKLEMGYTLNSGDKLCNSPDGAVEDAEEYTKSLPGPTGTPCQSYASVDEVSAKDDSGDMSFCMAKYSKDVLKMMYMMRSHHMLTDVILVVQKELFHVHKVVLSAASPYFKAMFTGGLKESEMSRVELQGICPTAMGRMIYFMYTGNIRVTEVTVCQLLPAATMFQVPYVVDACCAFLERQLDPTNAIGISSFAEQHGCESLKQKANQFIERNFTQICQVEEFLQLSAIQLIGLIRKDELNVQGEREVYNAVLNWVKYDEDNRHPRMEHILYAVRCQLLPPSFLNDQMKNCEVLRRAPNCRRYLEEIFKDLTLHKRPAVKERRPNTTRMIFVSGGYLRGSLDIVEAFNVDDKTWTTLAPLRVPRSGLGAAFLKGNFYAVGGRNNTPGASFDSDWVDRYNPCNEQWRPCSPMTVPRHRSGVAVMDELLYAVGGSAGSEYHSSVEYFDPEEDRWTLVQPMHSKRFGVGVAVVNRMLYAIGGFDGNDRLASMECYHPENNAWTVLPSMKLGRSGAGVAALNQFIYVVGGFDGQNHLSSVERFDTDKGTWEMVAEIRTPRSALSLTVLDGKLYAMGGFDGQVFLTNVEVYDPAKNGWEDGTPLTSGRSGHASAVIYQPSTPSGMSSQESVTVPSGNENSNKMVPPPASNMNDEQMVTEDSGRGRTTVHNNSHNSSQRGTGNGHPDQREAVNRRTGTGPGSNSGDQLRAEVSTNNNTHPVPLNVAVPLGSTGSTNPFKNNLLDISLLKNMCDNTTTAADKSAIVNGHLPPPTSLPSPSSSSTGICSYFNQNTNSSVNSNNSVHLNSGTIQSQQSNNGGKQMLQVVNINNLMCEPGPSSSRSPVQSRSPADMMRVTSPPIRIAKKREADSPNIPCTPPHNGEIKIRPAGDANGVSEVGGGNFQQPMNSGVKTFLPIVDFQNQRKYRRKVNPMPVRHPSYNASGQQQEVQPQNVVPETLPVHVGRCATMNKIKEAVKQKLFSPSILGTMGCGGYQVESQRMNGTGNRRSVLSNVVDGGNGVDLSPDEDSDSYPMEDEGR